MSRILAVAVAALLALPAVASAKLVSFHTPSGNIQCLFAKLQGTRAGLRCEIRVQDNPQAPKPANCDLDYGDAYGLGPHGRAGRVCHGDTVADPNGRVLDYGTHLTFHGMTCRSKTSGLRCFNRSGHGFQLSRSAQFLF
ncbi:MAG: hypothetical protein QOF76_2096 [Solirubrobacteraceae bacterium]|jgi:hypothetical protein|nr:hypothetical protein [Solirubrobacteraceae bacterium]